MGKFKFALAGIFISACVFAYPQNGTPKGKAIIQVFGNFHSGFGSERNDRGFELDRSYLGYQYSLSDDLSVKAVMDIGRSNYVGDYQRIAYIKNAQVTWKTGNLTLNGGLISTNQFNLQEKFWGYRYIMKSFQDLYKFGQSADLGMSASYAFANWISADAIIVNGEGYKKIQKDDGLLYGLGATVNPVKYLTFRIYGSINERSEETTEDVLNWAAFAGYSDKIFSIGLEYDIIQNYNNKKNCDLYGLSVYGKAKINKHCEIYARLDRLSSDDDWNEENDETAIMAGAQFKLGEYIKIAPNFRTSIPAAAGADEKYMAYISCYFGL